MLVLRSHMGMCRTYLWVRRDEYLSPSVLSRAPPVWESFDLH